MITCQKCATPVPDDARFCSQCGAEITNPDEPWSHRHAAKDEFLRRVQAAASGEFEILDELGSGGMGTVFLAREIALDREVALKVLPPAFLIHPNLRERFKREARLAARLDHPGITPVYRVVETEDLIYYTMKYVRGRSLKELLKDQGPQPLERIRKILIECARALGYAHDRGVIHRDVKPANILIEDEGGGVVLTDFGIARPVSSNTALTASGELIGTPAYMSPEQCRGGDLDGRSDQYSLAIVGYELLAGAPPFEGETYSDILYQKLFEDPPPLAERAPGAPVPVVRAIEQAMAREPDDRFGSMGELGDALHAAAATPTAGAVTSPETARTASQDRDEQEPAPEGQEPAPEGQTAELEEQEPEAPVQGSTAAGSPTTAPGDPDAPDDAPPPAVGEPSGPPGELDRGAAALSETAPARHVPEVDPGAPPREDVSPPGQVPGDVTPTTPLPAAQLERRATPRGRRTPRRERRTKRDGRGPWVPAAAAGIGLVVLVGGLFMLTGGDDAAPNPETTVDEARVMPSPDNPQFTPYDRDNAPVLAAPDRAEEAFAAAYQPFGAQGVQGAVTLWILLDTAGAVQSTRVLRSSGNAQLDSVTSETIAGLRFTPATYRGQRVAAWIQKRFSFTAREQPAAEKQ